MKNLFKKTLLISLSLLCIFCNNKLDRIELSNNSYHLVFNSNDTIKLDLYDSTYCFFDERYFNGINKWKLETTHNISYLKLSNSFFIKLDENYIKTQKGEIMGYNNIPVELIVSKSKWNQDNLKGSWIKKSDIRSYKKINEEDAKFLPPPPPPFASESIPSFVYTPIFKIKSDTLYFNDWYFEEKSKFITNLTNDVLLLDLKIPLTHYRIKTIEIKDIIKDTMYVQIYCENYSGDSKIQLDTLVKVKQ